MEFYFPNPVATLNCITCTLMTCYPLITDGFVSEFSELLERDNLMIQVLEEYRKVDSKCSITAITQALFSLSMITIVK